VVIKSLQELNNDFMGKTQTNGHGFDAYSVGKRDIDERGIGKRDIDESGIDELSIVESGIDESGIDERNAKMKIVLVIMAIPLLFVLFFGVVTGNLNSCFGYSFFTVLSQSMQSEIPKGSLIVVKQIDPQSLRIGDNITFKRDRTTTVTHKIVVIHENYNDSGARGFVTMGIHNTVPDTEIVYADNIIGVVSLCIPVLGDVLAFVSENAGIICLLLGGSIAAVVMVNRIFRKE